MHFSMCFFHWNWIEGKQLDVHFFYNTALNADNWFDVFGIGSRFISFLIFPFVKLGVSYLGLFVLFSSISIIGYINFYRLLKPYMKGVLCKLISAFLLLLPSIHFWTSFFGKEALVFPLMILVLLKLTKSHYKSPLLYISLLLILLIRPYLFFLILLAIIFAVITEKKILNKKLIVYGVIFSGTLAVPILIKFLKITSINSFVENYDKIVKYAAENGGSSINLLESNYFERFFLVLFRPLFYDVETIYQGFISIENGFVLIGFMFLGFSLRKVKFSEINLETKFVFFTCVFIVLFLSIYMYNLGLASRMRVMFIPYLIYGVLKLKSSIKNN